MEYHQQGDVLCKPAENANLAGFKKLDHKILAHGESGHIHVAEAEDVELFLGPNGELIMKAPTGTVVRHEEHKPITVPPGTYTIGAVQEFDHFRREAHNVLD